ncbi:MAG: oligosaccharide flippase family protein [Fibrobacteria bacterium]
MRKILKELGSHSLTYFVGSVAVSASSIVLLPVYTRYLSKTDYGILELLDSMNSMLLILFMSGLGSAYAKFHNDTIDERGRKEVFGTSFWFILGSTTVWVALLNMHSGGLARQLLGSEAHGGLISINLAVIWVNTLYILFTYYLNVHKMPGAFLGFSLAKLGINIGFNLYFIVHLSMGPKGMLLGDVLSSSITGLVLFIIIVRRNGLPFRLRLLRQALYFGLPFVPSLLCAALMHRVDRYLLEKFTSLGAVGIYSIGYKLPFMLGSLLMQSFGRIFGTSAQFEIAKQENASRIYAKITTYFFIVITVAEFTLGILSTSVLRILTVPAYYPAAPIIQIVAAGVCVYSLHSFFLVAALVKNKTWHLPISYFVAAMTAVVLNYVLLPRFGYIAAAWVMCLSYLFFTTTLYFSLNRFYPIPYEFKRMGVLFLVGVATMLSGNALTLASVYLDTGKQILLVCVLPAFVLLTPFLKREEAEEVAKGLGRFLPRAALWYRKVRKIMPDPAAPGFGGRNAP